MGITNISQIWSTERFSCGTIQELDAKSQFTQLHTSVSRARKKHLLIYDCATLTFTVADIKCVGWTKWSNRLNNWAICCLYLCVVVENVLFVISGFVWADSDWLKRACSCLSSFGCSTLEDRSWQHTRVAQEGNLRACVRKHFGLDLHRTSCIVEIVQTGRAAEQKLSNRSFKLFPC